MTLAQTTIETIDRYDLTDLVLNALITARDRRFGVWLVTQTL